MPLIRLDCDERSSTSPGLTESLEAARDCFLRDHTVDFDNESNLCPRLPAQLSFFALPEQQLLAYEKHRENCELGHIFRIANGLHDFIDALVVIGSGGGWLGAQSLAIACCDPYHNELSRAARGSKPRIYFADNELDNDQLRSLMGRLSVGGYGDGSGEKGWAVIGIEPQRNTRSDPTVLDHLVSSLNDQTTTWDNELRSRLVTSVRPVSRKPSACLTELGFDQSLFVPDNLDSAFTVLTPVGLLSAAFLGFDCIQLLVGAAAINANFRQEPFHKNLVLQFIAANRQPASDWRSGMARSGQSATTITSPSRRLFGWWARSLRGFLPWISSLWPDICSLDVASPSEQEILLDGVSRGWMTGAPLICNHVHVDSIRTDPLPATPGKPRETVVDGGSLTDRCDSIAAQTRRQLSQAGIHQNRIMLPEIDTHSLGQLIQMILLATAIEASTVDWGLNQADGIR